MSVFWNSRVRSLKPYLPGEQPRDRKFIKLNTNENPYPPSPRVTEAIARTAGADLRLYPDPASTALREAIAERTGVRPEQVFAGNGSDEVLAFVFAAFFENGGTAEPVLFPDITYSFYPVYARLWGVPFETVPLSAGFTLDLSAYRRPSGGVIFPNPNAPTGILHDPAELLLLARDLAARNRVLVVDEAYGVFAPGTGKAAFPLSGAASLLPYINEYPNILTVHTFSKAGSLAGLRAGFAAGSEPLIAALCRVRDSFNSYPLDALAAAGAEAAARDGEYYAETTARIIGTRERTVSALRDRGFEVLPSAANFMFIRRPGKSGAALFAGLRKRGILARHFNGPRTADFLRVSAGTDSDMDFFVQAITETLEET
ncbi:MAG: aminotransferase class I/II-fold pyridoxal phosphate-dependent enzyme [Spirochaetaceae bacterium]|jgi:histidinol-phosphate aminotransferase|nr:aminotransferase class I/II-fold pyridoxal phosphate-dependent enzyme [Spirochaetaceae bacterium]